MPLIPIVQQPGQREGSVLTEGALLENCYPETRSDGSQHREVVKRPGVSLTYTCTATVGRGMTYWNDQLVSVFGARVYINNVNISATVSGTGPVTFAATGGSSPRLMLSDGTDAYFFTSSWAFAKVNGTASATAFSTHVPGLAHLDGYIFQLQESGAIQHSELREPLKWPALNLITAESDPDKGRALARHHNFLVALGEYSAEFFYNAANTTGSVLARVDGAKLPFGCANGRTVADVFGTLIWVTNDRKVLMLERQKPSFIATAPVIRILQNATLTDARAFFFQIKGHTFYVLTLPTTNITLVYDLSEQTWFRIRDTNGNYWPFGAAWQDNATSVVFLQHLTDGFIYTITPNGWRDGANDYTVMIRTDSQSFGTGKPKTLRSVQVIGDRSTGSLHLRYTDDNFTSYSATRSVALSLARPKLWALGRFQQRAFELTHRANEMLRIYALDFDLI